MTSGALSVLSPVTTVPRLPSTYPRHNPQPEDLRAGFECLVGEANWTSLDWSQLIECLITLGSADIPLGRLVEGHVDALRILSQAGAEPRPECWYGVWASRSAGTGVAAVADGAVLALNGTIRFASGAGIIDRALIPVWLDPDTHLLVDLALADLPVDRSQWVTAAMRASQTHTVLVQDVVVPKSDVIGEPGFYLGRPEFLPGGIGVAAVWTGGLVRVLEVATAALNGGPPVRPAQLIRLGRARQRLVAALAVVRAAGHRLDELMASKSGEGSRDRGVSRDAVMPELCTECRAVVSECIVTALAEIRYLAGPATLAFDADLGHGLDDLSLYVAQLNGDAEAERLGSGMLEKR